MAKRRNRPYSGWSVNRFELELAKLLEQADCPGGASETFVSEAESRLNLSFPPSYRRFLTTYGAALSDGKEIAGIDSLDSPESCPYWTSLVSINEEVRNVSAGRIPMTHLLIATDGCDDYYYLDLSAPDIGGECPVVVLGPGSDNLPLAKSFAEFAVRHVRDELVY